jgi:hypothetical protein
MPANRHFSVPTPPRQQRHLRLVGPFGPVSALHECADLGLVVLIATHRLSINAQRERRVGVPHFLHDQRRALAERAEQRAARSAQGGEG